MASPTQFWFALIVIGIFVLGIVFGPAIALEGALVYAALLIAGVVFVRAALARRAA
jgi:hypothetical protein